MEFEAWKKAINADIKRLGFNKTYRKFGLSSSALRGLVNGDEYAGLRSWRRLGEHVDADKLKDPVKK